MVMTHKEAWIDAANRLSAVDREIEHLENMIYELRDRRHEIAENERVNRNAFLKHTLQSSHQLVVEDTDPMPLR